MKEEEKRRCAPSLAGEWMEKERSLIAKTYTCAPISEQRTQVRQNEKQVYERERKNNSRK